MMVAFWGDVNAVVTIADKLASSALQFFVVLASYSLPTQNTRVHAPMLSNRVRADQLIRPNGEYNVLSIFSVIVPSAQA